MIINALKIDCFSSVMAGVSRLYRAREVEMSFLSLPEVLRAVSAKARLDKSST